MLDHYNNHTSVLLPVKGASYLQIFLATKSFFREKLSIGLD